MEVRVESALGTSLPPGCHISVRIGDVLKQGRYEPQRCYNFSQPERRKNAKIDIYQHIGTAVVAVDPEAKSMHEVKVTSSEPTFSDMRLQVNVQSKFPGTSPSSKPAREERLAAMKTKAKDYLTSHRIEERLSDAVKALLKEQPADPTEFLCRKLRADVAEEPKPKPSATKSGAVGGGSAPKTEPMLPFCSYYSRHFPTAMPDSIYRTFPSKQRSASKDASRDDLRKKAAEDLTRANANGTLSRGLGQLGDQGTQAQLEHLRELACDALFKASDTGALERVLLGIRDEKQPTSARTGNVAGPSRPMVMTNVDVLGSAFASMGMQPNVMLI